jgi:hypothetical protein
MPTVRENLIAAKALIDTPEKWGKGDGMSQPVGCHCAESACAAVASDFNKRERLWTALGLALPGDWKRKFEKEEVSTHHFNDHPDTTHADIMALFDRAISAAQ